MNESQNNRIQKHTRNSTNPGFFSEQVSRARYYYQTLTPSQHDQLVVVCGGMEHCRPDYAIRRDQFRYYSIEFVASGQGELILGTKRYQLRAGSVFSYGPHQSHAITTDSQHPMIKHFIDFAGTEAVNLLKSLPFGSEPVHTCNPLHIIETFADIEQSAKRETKETKAICAMLLRVLCMRVSEEVISAPDSHDRALYTYQRCLNLIESQFMQLRNLQEISQACHVAPAYICRLFRRFGDTTPGRHLARLRMKHAANRLQDRAVLVQQVAQELDYSDPFHFSRAFKQIHGLSPREFRELTSRAS